MSLSRSGAWGSTYVACGALTAYALLLADTMRRAGWSQFQVGRHFLASLLVMTVAGVVLGVFAALVDSSAAFVAARAARSSPRARFTVHVGVLAGLAVLASWPTATWAFAGDRVRDAAMGKVGPWLLAGGTGLAVVVTALVARAAASAGGAGRRGRMAALLAVLVAGAVLFAVVDLTFFVALYGRLHTALEAAAAALIFTVLLVLTRVHGGRSRGFRRFSAVVTLHGFGWVVAFAVSSPLRRHVSDALAHTWRSPAYVDRALLRLQTADSFIRRPGAWRGLAASRLAHIQERYDITTVALAPKWTENPEPRARGGAGQRLRKGPGELSVVFFYVDTLRHDVAHDPATMPRFAEFARDSLVFDRAYAPASDTLRSLPALVNGSWDLRPHRNDLQHLVRREQIPSKLFLAKSAAEFLEKLLPSFAFDERLVVSDYPSDAKDVWGYGADRSTALPLVDAALAWIREREGRFFTWIFQYDVHNWRELRQEHIDEVASAHGMTAHESPIFRYQVAARGVDAAFARFLDGLEQAGRADDTIVVFVADHGEALGREGFWVHSIFLWESLIRVPLAIRIPGVPARRVAAPVSLVDVVPTLAPMIASDQDGTGFHGDDLLAHTAAGSPPRRHPILISATSQHMLVRVGVIEDGYKLVLPIESGVAELYDLAAADPDAEDVSGRDPPRVARLLSEVVRSPAFPRAEAAGH